MPLTTPLRLSSLKKAFQSVVIPGYLVPCNITELLPCPCGHREQLWLGYGYCTCTVLSGLLWGEWMVTEGEQACLEDLGLLSKVWKSKQNLRDLKAAFISGCAAQKELSMARSCSCCKFPSKLKVKDIFPQSCPTRSVYDKPSPGKHQCLLILYIYIKIEGSLAI